LDRNEDQLRTRGDKPNWVRQTALAACVLSCAASLAGAESVPAVAVAEFEVIGEVNATNPGRAVAELITARFDRRRYRLVERAALRAVLDEHDLTIAGIVANPLALKGRELRGVQYVLVGSIVRFGDLTITARLVDVGTGEVIRVAEWRGSNLYSLRQGLDMLAVRLGIATGPSGAAATPGQAVRTCPAEGDIVVNDRLRQRRYSKVSPRAVKLWRGAAAKRARLSLLGTDPWDAARMVHAELTARHLAAKLNQPSGAEQDIALLARAQDLRSRTEIVTPDKRLQAEPSFDASRLERKVTLVGPYEWRLKSYAVFTAEGSIPVQAAVKQVLKQVGLPFDAQRSRDNIQELADRRIRPNIRNLPCRLALKRLLSLAHLTYRIRDGRIVLDYDAKLRTARLLSPQDA